MIEVKINPIRGVNEATQRRITTLSRRVRNTILPNYQVATWLQRWVNENFRTQGSKVGGWKPFKHGGRRIKGGGIDTSAKLLQDTGALRGSTNHFYTRRTAGIGLTEPYAIYHDVGAKNLPQRRILPVDTDKEVTEAVIKIYESYLLKVMQ